MASNAGPGMGATGKQKSKAYLSSVAIQSDATKYRQKYKELKRKENDKLQVTTLRIKQNIQRLRLERAILFERLEAEMHTLPAPDQGGVAHDDTTATHEENVAPKMETSSESIEPPAA